ncbi:MAG: helix-turn-helix domain-containing protein [Candidatus Wenzhouxiangella sp. M2_3B_020]
MKSISARIPLGRAIRSRRVQMHISQELLAEYAGLHRTYIGGVERGERNVGFDNLQHLAEALRLPLSELLAAAELLVGPMSATETVR